MRTRYAHVAESLRLLYLGPSDDDNPEDEFAVVSEGDNKLYGPNPVSLRGAEVVKVVLKTVLLSVSECKNPKLINWMNNRYV